MTFSKQIFLQQKPKTLNPRWLEQFDLRIFDDHSKTLEMTVYDHDISRDDFMGRYEMCLWAGL